MSSIFTKIVWAQSGKCPDCKIVEHPEFNDVQICQPHSLLLDEQETLGQQNHKCGEDQYVCQECCDHSNAYDRAKDIWKYGSTTPPEDQF